MLPSTVWCYMSTKYSKVEGLSHQKWLSQVDFGLSDSRWLSCISSCFSLCYQKPPKNGLHVGCASSRVATAMSAASNNKVATLPGTRHSPPPRDPCCIETMKSKHDGKTSWLLRIDRGRYSHSWVPRLIGKIDAVCLLITVIVCVWEGAWGCVCAGGTKALFEQTGFPDDRTRHILNEETWRFPHLLTPPPHLNI